MPNARHTILIVDFIADSEGQVLLSRNDLGQWLESFVLVLQDFRLLFSQFPDAVLAVAAGRPHISHLLVVVVFPKTGPVPISQQFVALQVFVSSIRELILQVNQTRLQCFDLALTSLRLLPGSRYYEKWPCIIMARVNEPLKLRKLTSIPLTMRPKDFDSAAAVRWRIASIWISPRPISLNIHWINVAHDSAVLFVIECRGWDARTHRIRLS